MSYDNENEVTHDFFESLLSRPKQFRNIYETEWFYFQFSSTALLQISQDINFKLGGSYIDSPDCIKTNPSKPKKWWW